MANSADQDQKPADLDLHCLQRQDISGFRRTRVKIEYRLTKGSDMRIVLRDILLLLMNRIEK